MRRHSPLVSLVAAALVTATLISPEWPAGVARADKADDELAKYDKGVEKAVNRGLAYLHKTQSPNGAWPTAGLGDNTGVASLCVMTFLSAGHVPGRGRYGKTIDKGVDYVLSAAKPNGLIVDRTSHGPMYSHGISTLLLCEVSGMVSDARQKKIDQVLPAALKVILAAQQTAKSAAHRGGWRYQPTSGDADISCAGWQLMSLRAAKHCGAQIPAESISQAVGFIERCTASDGGFSYQPGGASGLARTGTGVLCLELCGKHHSPKAIAGGEWALKNPVKDFGGTHFYYGVYYASQGMFQLGGTYWTRFARQLYPLMLKHQKPDGSWPRGSSNEAQAGPSYATAMSILSLTVSYRQLPIYQR